MRKIMVLDTETTGTNPAIHAITQIAGITVVGGVQVGSFDIKVRPFDGAVIEDEALKITGMTKDDLLNAPERIPYGMAKKRLQDECTKHVDKYRRSDKLWFLGYNAAFDAGMIRAMWERCHDPYFGSIWFYPIIDVAQAAAIRLGDARAVMPNFKLATVCRHVGIEFDDDEAHEALYDVTKTLELWQWCRALEGGQA